MAPNTQDNSTCCDGPEGCPQRHGRGDHGHGRGHGHGGHGHGCGATRLGDFTPGQRGVVVGYRHCHRDYKRKLLHMGLVRGTEFTVLRVAPLGDPIELDVGGFHLSLRKAEAQAMKVELL